MATGKSQEPGNFVPALEFFCTLDSLCLLCHHVRDAHAAISIDHIAFEIPLTDFAVEVGRLKGLGLEVETAEHTWVHWRSLYVIDPEGNQVELVAYDPSV